MRYRLVAVLISACACPPGAARAWGDEGHRVVALIARGLMTPAAVAAADRLLDLDGAEAAQGFARMANWADYWRFSHRETAPWHYVDIEIDAPDLAAACHGFPPPGVPASSGPTEDCIVGRIRAFAAELADGTDPTPERATALKFLLHFVGDLHQPLHAADHRDRGGNCVRLAFAGTRTGTLHGYWDTGVVEHLDADPAKLAATLRGRITAADRARWSGGDPASWALETFAVAKASAYTLGTPPGCGRDAAPIALPPGYEAEARARRRRCSSRRPACAWPSVLDTRARSRTARN